MDQLHTSIDIMGHQRRWEQEGEALSRFLEATEHIKSIDEEQHRQSNQLRDQTDQLKAHNRLFEEMNTEMEKESIAREAGDRKNRRITIIAVLLTCFLTFFLDHIFDIFHLLFPG